MILAEELQQEQQQQPQHSPDAASPPHPLSLGGHSGVAAPGAEPEGWECPGMEIIPFWQRSCGSEDF